MSTTAVSSRSGSPAPQETVEVGSYVNIKGTLRISPNKTLAFDRSVQVPNVTSGRVLVGSIKKLFEQTYPQHCGYPSANVEELTVTPCKEPDIISRLNNSAAVLDNVTAELKNTTAQRGNMSTLRQLTTLEQTTLRQLATLRNTIDDLKTRY